MSTSIYFSDLIDLLTCCGFLLLDLLDLLSFLLLDLLDLLQMMQLRHLRQLSFRLLEFAHLCC